MDIQFERTVWDTLSKINVNDKVEMKNNLAYLSWAWAWGELMKYYPQSTYIIKPHEVESDGSVMVNVELTVKENNNQLTRVMWLPVMDFKNKSIINPSSVDINKAVMRCLTKAISMFGLGFYIYAGEDLPEEEKKAQKQTQEISEEETTKKRTALIKSVEEVAKKGTQAMREFWTSLSTEDQLLIGVEEKRRIYAIAQGYDNGNATA